MRAVVCGWVANMEILGYGFLVFIVMLVLVDL